MPRALLAWEGGDGRGHITTLKTVAEYLGDRFSFDAALCRSTHKSELEPLCDKVLAGPSFHYSGDARAQAGGYPCATWGEYLGDIGFRDEAALTSRITWWQKVIRERDISLVIADFAPCALMAARGLGVRCAAVGIAYSVPPATMSQFPQLLPEYSHRIYDETKMVAAVNAAASQFGVPPLRYLSEVYGADDQLVFSLPFLDPYLEHRTAPLLPPVGTDITEQVASGGDEIFVYFSTINRDELDIVSVLADLGIPLRIYLPTLDAHAASRFAEMGVLIETRPVHIDDIARRTRLMVNSAPHGTFCMGLAAGIPQVVFPQHLEQLYLARQVEKNGVVCVLPRSARTSGAIRRTVTRAYGDVGMGQRARSFANQIRPLFNTNRRQQVRRRLDFI